MEQRWLYCYIAILLIGFSVPKVWAELKINEIYPAPASGEKEWVEFYNDEDKQITLDEYSIYDLADNKINFDTNTVEAYGYITASCTNILNNSGDTVFLKKSNEEIESVSYTGSFSAEKSFVRCPDGSGSWLTLTSQTKNSSNQTSCPSSPSPTLSLPPTPSPTSTPVPTIILSQFPVSNIFISEVMVNPEKDNNEWIELFNDNDFDINLNNWYLDDGENTGSTPRTFSLIISAKNYATYELTSSVFNNDGDQVRLLDSSQNLKDDFEYSFSETGKTWGRINFSTDDFCLQEPTKNSTNSSCLNSSVSPTLTNTPTPTNQPTNQPTEKPIQSLTPKPTLEQQFSIFNQPLTTNNSPPQVLGIKTNQSKNPSNNLVRTLSFTSLCYSLLTIVSIFLKINR